MVYLHTRSRFESDAAIVGAGPAGAAAAAHMARAGLRVTLIDRRRFPRDKVCGDFVGPVAISELEKLGVTAQPAFLLTNVIRNAALYLNGQQLIKQSIPKIDRLPQYGRVIPRRYLDYWIVQAARSAGVEVLEGYQVMKFTPASRHVTVLAKGHGRLIHIRARLLLGADGSTSLIARLLRGHAVPRENLILAARAYFEGVNGPANQAELYFSNECFPGYCWLFPTGLHAANVGVGMVLETMPSKKHHPRELLLRLIGSDPALNARLRKASIKSKIVGFPLTTYNPELPIVGPRCMLIGDAAGLINPLNGEGIQYALQSARWAAETAVSCAATDDFSTGALSAYAHRVENELRFDMAVCNLIVHAIRNRSLNPIWLKILRIIAERARRDVDYAKMAGGILIGIIPAKWALSMVSPTIEQALLSSGLRTTNLTQRESSRLIGTGIRVFRSFLGTAWDASWNRSELLQWFSELMLGVEELADQHSKSSTSTRP